LRSSCAASPPCRSSSGSGVSTSGGLIWAVQFGYYRYGLVLEIAGSLLIVWSLSRWSRWAVVAAGVMCLPLLVVFHTKSLDRDENLFTRVPPVAPDSHVLLEAEKPVSYLALSFPDSASFASLSDFGEVFRVDGPLADDLREFVRRGLAEGNLYVVTAATGEPDLSVLSPISLELERSTCREFQERSRVLRLCRAVDGAGA